MGTRMAWASAFKEEQMTKDDFSLHLLGETRVNNLARLSLSLSHPSQRKLDQ